MSWCDPSIAKVRQEDTRKTPVLLAHYRVVEKKQWPDTELELQGFLTYPLVMASHSTDCTGTWRSAGCLTNQRPDRRLKTRRIPQVIPDFLAHCRVIVTNRQGFSHREADAKSLLDEAFRRGM